MQLDFRWGSSGGIARSLRGFFAHLGPGVVLSSAMADLAASMPELTSPGLDIICVQPVRSAFKDELAIIINDHGEAVTIEVVVFGGQRGHHFGGQRGRRFRGQRGRRF